MNTIITRNNKIIVSFFIFFCMMLLFQIEVFAGGGYTSDGYDLTYRVNDIKIQNERIEVYGYAYQEPANYDYVIKSKVGNHHYYELLIGNQVYQDLNDYYIDHTTLHSAIGWKVIKYQNVGFHFSIPIQDLIKNNYTFFDLQLRIKHQNRPPATIALSYIHDHQEIKGDGYIINISNSNEPVQLYTATDNVFVRKSPSKSGQVIKYMNNSLYFTPFNCFSFQDGSLTGKTHYDAVNKVYWYEVRYRVTNKIRNRWRVASDPNGQFAWICDSFVKYSGKVTIFKITKQEYTIEYIAPNATNIPTSQKKIYNQDIKLSNLIPKKIGFYFQGWSLDQKNIHYQPGQNYQKNSNLKLYAIFNNHQPIIEGPVIQKQYNFEVPPFISNQTVIIQQGDVVNLKDFVQAKDQEDGNITSKVICHQTIPFNQPGDYDILFSVRDKGGQYQSKIIQFTINSPPRLNVSNLTFFENQTVTTAQFLKKTSASDQEDGDLTNKIKIVKIEYPNSTIQTNPYFFNSNIENDGSIITYQVTDNYRKTETKKIQLNIVKRTVTRTKTNLRYIDKNNLNSLSVDSKWQEINNYQKLIRSLNKENVITYTYSKSEVIEIKKRIKSTKPVEALKITY